VGLDHVDGVDGEVGVGQGLAGGGDGALGMRPFSTRELTGLLGVTVDVVPADTLKPAIRSEVLADAPILVSATEILGRALRAFRPQRRASATVAGGALGRSPLGGRSGYRRRRRR